MTTFNLPDLGEGLPDAEIVAWHVAEGDSVKTDDLLVSVETAKAVVEVPSPYTGVVVKLHGAAGDIIATGGPLVEFSEAAAANAPAADPAPHQSAPPQQQSAPPPAGGGDAPPAEEEDDIPF